jgi:hypothetical protein
MSTTPNLSSIATACRSPFLCALLLCAPHAARSQQAHAALNLPDAPGYAEAYATNPAQEQSGSATLGGTIQDANGAVVPQAQATLTSDSQTSARTTQSDNSGHFVFQALPAGTYKLTIVSAGLETYVSPAISLAAGQQDDLPPITLAVATLKSDVQVTTSEEQVAEVQIHAEEKQRVLGIAPDFYSSYIWDAAPLDAHQKFVLASKSAFDPIAFLSIGAVAGIEQARNIYPGYHQGAEGYAKRYGASFADEAIGRFFASAIYPSIFRQDPRYFYKGYGTKTQRAEYAISRAFVTRGNNGKTQPNYSLFLGRLTAGAIANLYHDPSDRGAALTFENAFLNIGGHAFDNLAREFLFKRFTPKVPAFENGEASKTTPTKP